MNLNTYACLDIGDFYTKLVISSYNDDKCDILFAKKTPTKGISNGKVNSKAEANACIDYLLTEADKYGLPVDEVILVLPNKTIKVSRKVANIKLSPQDTMQITQNEINSLRNACMTYKIQPDDVVIDCQDINYVIDERSIEPITPIGMKANAIRLNAYVYTIKEDILSELTDLLEDVHLKIKKVVINSVASSNNLVEEEIIRGAYIVDIGATNLSLSFFKGGLLTEIKEGKLGGNFITYKMSNYLDIDVDEAEMLKLKYGNALKDTASDIVLYKANNGKLITERMIAFAIEEALNEVIEDINHTKDLMLVENADNYPMIIVGGTSSLYNLEEKMQKDIANKVIVRRKSTFGARNNVYIAACGAVSIVNKCLNKGEI